MMSNRQRLHPSAIIFSIIKVIKDSVFPVIIFFITTLAGSGLLSTRMFWLIIVTIAFFAVMFIVAVIRWYRFHYSVEEDGLRIEYGVLIRNKRFIPQERIQTVNLTETVFHRLFNTVKVEIDTAGSSLQSEGGLTSINYEEAQYIKSHFSNQKAKHTIDNEENSADTIYTLNMKDLLIEASTSSGMGVFFIIIAGIFQLDYMIPTFDLLGILTGFIESNLKLVLFVLPIVVVLSWVFSVIGSMLKNANFTLKKEGNNLYISRGLLEKREIAIPIKRIQAIRVVEGIIRQPFGFVTVYVQSAGYGNDLGESTVLFPLLRRKKLYSFLESTVPKHFRIEGDLDRNDALVRLPRRSLLLKCIRYGVPALLMAAAMIYYLPWGWVSSMFVLFALAIAYFSYKDAGWMVEEGNRFTMRYRLLSRTTIICPKYRIQSAHVNQSLFQRRSRTTTILILIAGSIGVNTALWGVDEQEGMSFLHWFQAHKTRHTDS